MDVSDSAVSWSSGGAAYAAIRSSSETILWRISVGRVLERNPTVTSVPIRALYGDWLIPGW